MKLSCWLLILSLGVGACSSPLTKREKGALLGGGAGAGLGALIGGGTGAVIGGAAGALGGGVIGDQLQSQDHRLRKLERGRQD